jgi:hypothetical protein
MVMNLTVDYPELTGSAIAEARKLIGVPLRRYPGFTDHELGAQYRRPESFIHG